MAQVEQRSESPMTLRVLNCESNEAIGRICFGILVTCYSARISGSPAKSKKVAFWGESWRVSKLALPLEQPRLAPVQP